MSALVKRMLGEVGLVPGGRSTWSMDDPLEERREVQIGREIQKLLPYAHYDDAVDKIWGLTDELIQMHSSRS